VRGRREREREGFGGEVADGWGPKGEGGGGSNRRAHGACGERGGGWAVRGPRRGGEGRDAGWATAGSRPRKRGEREIPLFNSSPNFPF
jgi:hypothetical protein